MTKIASKISVIIPVYNVEKYVEECINSITNQTYENLEIIIVDDGSIDNSYNICKKLADKDKRIRLFHKKNEGVSSARNFGISKSTGDYISFIDSDDTLDKKTYEEVLKKIKNNDLITYNWNKIYKNEIQKCGIQNNMVLAQKEAIKLCLLSENSFSGYLWNKLFKSSIIKNNKLLFDENISICEDLLFVLDYLKYASSIIATNDYFYNYKMRKSAASKIFNLNKYCTIFNSYSRIVNLCNELNIEEKYIIEYEYLFNYFLYKKRIIKNIEMDYNIISDYKNVMKYEKISFKQKKELFIIKNFNLYFRIKNKLKNIFINKLEMYE